MDDKRKKKMSYAGRKKEVYMFVVVIDTIIQCIANQDDECWKISHSHRRQSEKV